MIVPIADEVVEIAGAARPIPLLEGAERCDGCGAPAVGVYRTPEGLRARCRPHGRSLRALVVLFVEPAPTGGHV